jgi:ubiquinone/menaquinone biosynthesis C-methylase UbiE
VAELNPISRFFVNAFASRRSARRFVWVREHVTIPAGATCLEVGSGNGGTAALLVDHLRPARFIATDLDPRQLDAARRYLARRYPAGVPAALELQPADMLHLTFPADSFDAVFAFVALHHASPSHLDFSKIPDALAEVDRVLRKGGLLVYEEIVHREKIAAWLAAHGYSVRAERHRWRHSILAVQKPG